MPGIDALVVGAGPAGLATAIGLARRGARAVVLEHRRPPLDKACGEGIMPAGVRLLAGLGVDLARLGGAPMRGIRFLDGARVLEGTFATGPGLGVRRTALSAGLVEAAERAGVELRFGCGLLDWRADAGGVCARTAQGELRTRVLIGADGLGSRIRMQAGLAESPGGLAGSEGLAAGAATARDARARSRARRARLRWGLRRHYRVTPWSDCVEVHWGDGVEAYVTPVARDEVGVAFLFRGAGGHGGGGDPAALLPGFPALAARLAGAETTSGVRGSGPFWQRARARTAPGVALVGDAAGYTDAVTGEGITLALRCAEALAAIVAEGAPLAQYEAEWLRLSRVHRRFAALLGFGVAHPGLRRAAFAALERMPGAFEALLRLAAEEEEPRESRWVASHRSA